jgi:hypothetical protein
MDHVPIRTVLLDLHQHAHHLHDGLFGSASSEPLFHSKQEQIKELIESAAEHQSLIGPLFHRQMTAGG